MERISASLELELKEAIVALAKRYKCSESSVVQRAVRDLAVKEKLVEPEQNGERG